MICPQAGGGATLPITRALAPAGFWKKFLTPNYKFTDVCLSSSLFCKRLWALAPAEFS